MVVQCCACMKIREGHVWIAVDNANLTNLDVSHGYCPACASQVFYEIRQLREIKRAITTRAAIPKNEGCPSIPARHGLSACPSFR